MPSNTCTNSANPPRKPSVLPTICTGRVQRQPRRMPSPKTPNRAAITQYMRKVMIMGNLESTGVCLEKFGDPRKIASMGINSNCTVRPQSKATAIPIPLGAGSCSALFAVELSCSVSFKAVSLSCSWYALAACGCECYKLWFRTASPS